MALRDFTDRDGREWQVWNTIPKLGASLRKHGLGNDRLKPQTDLPYQPFATGREQGWLTFASGKEKRRLSPIPEGWETASADTLSEYCELADRIPASEET